jgi:hypothetical protein
MMNMSALESSSFAEGYSKPPPYHIALYLPVPDDQNTLGKGKDSVDKGNNRISSGSRVSGVDQDHHISQSAEASFVCDKTDESDEEDGDEESGPDRKKQRKDEDEERCETPPPPYGQI